MASAIQKLDHAPLDTHQERSPVLGVGADNSMFVVWRDSSGGDYEIYVLRWDGSDWVEAGRHSAAFGGISDNENPSWFPQIALSNEGVPYVIWRDHFINDIYIRYWPGTK